MTKVRFYLRSIFQQAVFLCCLMLFAIALQGQNVPIPQDNSYQAWYNYYSSMPQSGEEDDDSDAAQFMKWAHFWESRLVGDDIPSGMAKANAFMQDFIDGGLTVCTGSMDDGINWESLGPFNSDGAVSGQSLDCTNTIPGGVQSQGRIEAISVRPEPPGQLPNEIVVGGYNGGIWKTTNANAANPEDVTWENTSYDEGYSMVGIRKLVRHPENPDIIYAATGGGLGVWNAGRAYGVGVIISTDGGDTWGPTGFNTDFGSDGFVTEMVIDPNSTEGNTIVYIGSGDTANSPTSEFPQLFKYQGNSDLSDANNWNSLFTNVSAIKDMEIEDNGRVWFVTDATNGGDGAGLFRLVANSINIESITNYDDPLPLNCGPNDIDWRDISISIGRQEPQNHITLLVRYRLNSGGNCDTRFLFRSTDGGGIWEPPVPSPIEYAFNGMSEINPFNSDILYLERDNVLGFPSTGRCMNKLTNISTTNNFMSMVVDETHVDTRVIEYYAGDATGNDDIIYIGTDGGIAMTTNGQDFIDITGQGLNCTNFFGVGIAETRKDYIFTGAQDGSINFYNRGNWHQTEPGGDNGDCLINPNDPTRIIMTFLGLNDGVAQRYNLNANGTDVTSAGGLGVSNLGLAYPMLMNPTDPDEIFIPQEGNDGGLWIADGQGSGAYDIDTDQQVTAIGMSERNPDILYLGIRWRGFLQCAKRENGVWVIQSETLGSNLWGVTDIAVDPDDENNIWVSIGSFNQGGEYRKVMNSKDGGLNWESVSDCLPNIPMTSICYQKGSNDGIYVGSDFGVFYKNADMDEWIHYGNEGPRTIVADMEIDNCAGELVVATQGAGLWRVPLLPIESEKVLTSEEDIIWDYSRTIANNVRISTGTTLRVEGATINFAPNKGIIVEKGAQLIINNSTLTNLCGGMWRGIKIDGDWQESQNFCPNATNAFPCEQGYVSIRKGSTIENAQIGVNIEDAQGARGGGILKASESYFINNETAVWFAPFQNTNPLNGQLTGNYSDFRLCRFLINDAYVGKYQNIKQQVKLNAVTGIEFYGCQFNNAHSDRTFINDGKTGIDARDSEFIVTNTCTSGQSPCPTNALVPSAFRGFERGIYAHNEKSVTTFRVTHSMFRENHVGIIAENIPNAYIVKNDFIVGGELPFQDNLYRGLELADCTGYQVEANKFLPNTTNAHIGACIIDSGDEPNEIYKNGFNGLAFANVANGSNQGLDTDIGLQYLCNTASENGYDFGVVIDATIAGNQGSGQESAGNSFTANPPWNNTHFANEGSQLSYFCVNGTDCPTNYSVNTIDLGNGQLVAECPSTLPEDDKGKLSDDEKSQYESEVNNDNSPTLNSPKKSRRSNSLIRDGLIDTTNYDLAYVRSRFVEKGNLKSRLLIVDSYLQEGNTLLASQELLSIANDFDLQDALIGKEYQYFNQLKALQISSLQEGISYKNMVENHESAIKSIADVGNYIASNQAKRMINEVIEPTYVRIVKVPGEQPDMLIQPIGEDNDISVSFLQPSVKAIPNPASNQTTFYFRLPEKATNGEIVITNLFGQLIEKIKVAEEVGSIDWQTSNLSNDVYIYTLQVDGKIIKTDRLVIAK